MAPNSPKQRAGVGIYITPRSLQGIFYFLSEMVRTELGLATGQAMPLAIPSGEDDPSPFRLFRLERRLPGPGEPLVTYHGEIFAMMVDPSGQVDASSRVVQLLTDLLASQSSAKSLPAPNLITISTP